MKTKEWIGVDLDGTLARFDSRLGLDYIGPPIELMVRRVQRWIAQGKNIRIFTARVSPVTVSVNGDGLSVEEVREVIKKWCIKYIGVDLLVTHEKDCYMTAIYDDLAVHVEKNTGRIKGENSGYGCR